MSGYAATLVWRHARAAGAARLVLLALAHVADDDGVAAVPRPRLAGMARIDERTVRRCLSDLVEMGEITVERGASGPGSPTVYRITAANRGQDAPDTWQEGGQSAPVTHELPEPAPDRAAPEREPAVPPATVPEGLLFPDDGAMAPGEDGGGDEKASGKEPFAVPPDFFARRPGVDPALTAPARPARVLPRHLPPGDLGQVLAALGVREGPRGLLYWWQREHKAELVALLDRLGLGVAELVARIEENHVSAPDLARVADIEGLV